jgi:hypothetical protein
LDFNGNEMKPHATEHFERGEGGDFIGFTNETGVPMGGVATEKATMEAYLKWTQQRAENMREIRP